MCIHGPFEHPPPVGALSPLPECLGNLICKEVWFEDFSRVGLLYVGF